MIFWPSILPDDVISNTTAMKQNRRNFLQITGTAASAALLSSLEGFAIQPTSISQKAKPGYQLKVLATNWGFDGSTDSFCAKAKKEGYDGVELWWPGTIAEQQEMYDAVKKHGLELAFLWGAGEGKPAEHIVSFKKTLDDILSPSRQKPLYVNLHAGRDFFAFDVNKKMVEYSLAASERSGIPIYHETHRGRMMYAAHVTYEYIQKYPGLRLTLDISHWCNVHESLLEDQSAAVEAAIQRTSHVHARVGYQEGPQVADPRAPEWKYAVDAHIAWWDNVVAQKRKNGQPITFLTEFGPPLYMQTLPYTLQPLSNQWDINVHMMHLLRKRYGS
jgi:sugar phosphate isomerase/epimerase